MSIHSQLLYDQSRSHARIPAGGINLIASIDSVSEAQFTASFFGSTKALHGEVAIPSAETSTHNHSNQQYSITAITTSAGAIAERYAYSAYGEPTILDSSGSVIASSSINNRYSYTGREWDATAGLYHFRARWMSPKSGRFLGRDPIGYEPGGNLYASEFRLRFVDPSGYWRRGDELTFWAWIQPLFVPPELPPSRDTSCPFPRCGGPVTNPYSEERVREKKYGGPDYCDEECRTKTPVAPPPGGWPTNGCGSQSPGALPIPDLWFGPACNNHDKCYYTCGKSQNDCDSAFGEEMKEICRGHLRDGTFTLGEYDKCVQKSRYYQAAVVAFAEFESGQDAGCTWGPCKFRYCKCRRGRPWPK